MNKGENPTSSIEQVLEQQGFLYRPIEGNSMMPLLDQTTDLVKLVPCKQPLKVYDLPLYRRPDGQLVLHRIIKVRRRHYVICGDNRIHYEKVPHGWVVALAVGRVRQDEYLAFEEKLLSPYLKTVCYPRDTFAFRFGVLIKRIFPNKKEMKRNFPILNSRPWLLPACYIIRILCTPFRKMQRRKDTI